MDANTGDIYAEGVDELIYGRTGNVLGLEQKRKMMAFKRNIDRLPISPKNARVQTVVCHYCIVGCGYKAISWPIDQQGGTRARSKRLRRRFVETAEGPDSDAWYSPAMYNVVKQDGQNVHIVIKPDYGCQVNSGLASVRRIPSSPRCRSQASATHTQEQRLTDPLGVALFGAVPNLVGRRDRPRSTKLTRRVIEEQGEDGLLVLAADHGGAGGGYEFTWATGKLYFESMKVKNIRIHNRPAYNSEVHATRDMGVGELNNCYEDAELADTIFAVGTNALETQTNYFLNHWIPNLRGKV